ncbi:MAG: NAD(P)/FAD-dependent oxidoreductase [Candidatus Omnitrophota bacterium]
MADRRFDVIVIGAGPAGMIAAATAAKSGKSVLLLEKNKCLGKKLRLTGNSRCNLTNISSLSDFPEHYVDAVKFLHNAFNVFYNTELINFFKESGLKVKAENKGRIFPASDNAQDVVNALERSLKQSGVEIKLNTNVAKIIAKNQKIMAVKTDCSEQINTEKVVIATGGKTYPATGSTGDGFNWAEKLGHNIINLRPGLSSLVIDNKWIKNLQGISFSDSRISLYINRKRKKTIEGELVFTHFGVSGPGILDISLFIDKIKKQDVILKIDFLPDLTQDIILNQFNDKALRKSQIKCKNFLTQILPVKFVHEILKISGILTDKKMIELSKREKISLINNLKSLELKVRQFFAFEQAMITRGGVDTREINPKTMESKIVPGLYFCGEILDVAGLTGGYNLQAAFSTGFAAGKNV